MKQRKLKKIAMSLLLCSTLIASMPTGISSVHATETTTTITDSVDTSNVDANGILGKNSDIGIEVTKSITGKAGKKTKISFKMKSNDEAKIKLKSVYPIIDSTFPFETSGDAYTVVSAGDNEEKQKEMEATFSMTARSDLITGYHSIRFLGEYSKISEDGSSTDYYVIKTINVYFTGKAPTTEAVSKPSPSTSTNNSNSYNYNYYGNDDDDDYDDEPDRYMDEDDKGTEVTAPKLLVKGYETKPKKIMAGEKFELTIHLQNTSKSTSVCNAKFLIGNEAGNFIPTSGSSAVFIDKIEPEKTGDLKIEFKTAADLPQKNYSLIIKGDFDDGKGTSFTSSDNLSLAVYQEVKLAVTDVAMSPESIGVGQDGALMFTINNQGSASVYNVTVSTEDDAVSSEQTYIGNIAAASSSYATLNLTGEKENSESGMIKIVIAYEDADGTAGKIEQEVSCNVGEEMTYDDEDEFGIDEDFDEDEGSPWIWIVIGCIVLVVIVVVIILLIKRKKKKEAELFEDDDLGEDDIEYENF